MSTIYKVRADTFKRGFTLYFTSIEKAIEMLPKTKEFGEAFGFMFSGLPDGEYWDYPIAMENVVLKISDDKQIYIYVAGECIVGAEYKTTPEVKEEGLPYKPSEIKKVREWRRENRDKDGELKPVFKINVYPIQVDNESELI